MLFAAEGAGDGRLHRDEARREHRSVPAPARERDTNFTVAFDAVVAAAGIQVPHTPARAPWANAYAERWVGTVRRAVLDRMLIFGCLQLQSVLAGYADQYNVIKGGQPLSGTIRLRSLKYQAS